MRIAREPEEQPVCAPGRPTPLLYLWKFLLSPGRSPRPSLRPRAPGGGSGVSRDLPGVGALPGLLLFPPSSVLAVLEGQVQPALYSETLRL